jgi:4-diphosphocytidyl-2C-methyl-D-erythritol kinase
MVAAMRRRGALQSAMSGSGSAVFGLFAGRAAAARAAAALSGSDWRTLVTRTLNRRSYRRLAGK